MLPALAAGAGCAPGHGDGCGGMGCVLTRLSARGARRRHRAGGWRKCSLTCCCKTGKEGGVEGTGTPWTPLETQAPRHGLRLRVSPTAPGGALGCAPDTGRGPRSLSLLPQPADTGPPSPDAQRRGHGGFRLALGGLSESEERGWPGAPGCHLQPQEAGEPLEDAGAQAADAVVGEVPARQAEGTSALGTPRCPRPPWAALAGTYRRLSSGRPRKAPGCTVLIRLFLRSLRGDGHRPQGAWLGGTCAIILPHPRAALWGVSTSRSSSSARQTPPLPPARLASRPAQPRLPPAASGAALQLRSQPGATARRKASLGSHYKGITARRTRPRELPARPRCCHPTTATLLLPPPSRSREGLLGGTQRSPTRPTAAVPSRRAVSGAALSRARYRPHAG